MARRSSTCFFSARVVIVPSTAGTSSFFAISFLAVFRVKLFLGDSIRCQLKSPREGGPSFFGIFYRVTINGRGENRIIRVTPDSALARAWLGRGLDSTKTNSVSGTGGGYKGEDVQVFTVSLS